MTTTMNERPSADEAGRYCHRIGRFTMASELRPGDVFDWGTVVSVRSTAKRIAVAYRTPAGVIESRFAPSTVFDVFVRYEYL